MCLCITYIGSSSVQCLLRRVLQLLARHSELEQSETKAQAALVTILCLTQITELKLLLDIGRQGHRFYDFVLTLLVACISLEIFVGVVIIYIGNLHYYRSATNVDDDRSSGKTSRGGTSPAFYFDKNCPSFLTNITRSSLVTFVIINRTCARAHL